MTKIPLIQRDTSNSNWFRHLESQICEIPGFIKEIKTILHGCQITMCHKNMCCYFLFWKAMFLRRSIHTSTFYTHFSPVYSQWYCMYWHRCFLPEWSHWLIDWAQCFKTISTSYYYLWLSLRFKSPYKTRQWCYHTHSILIDRTKNFGGMVRRVENTEGVVQKEKMTNSMEGPL